MDEITWTIRLKKNGFVTPGEFAVRCSELEKIIGGTGNKKWQGLYLSVVSDLEKFKTLYGVDGVDSNPSDINGIRHWGNTKECIKCGSYFSGPDLKHGCREAIT